MPTTATTRNRLVEALTIPEVLAELKVSRSTFYDWRAKKKAPPCYKLPNGDLRVRRDDLDAWWAAQEEESGR
jgi:predicted DNA-binding transcriptional regulator AlpA